MPYAPRVLLSLSLALLLITAAGAPAVGSDWTNSGGNAGRNGQSGWIGPAAPDLLWSGGRSSLISWQPVTEGNRMFVVRQPGWPGMPADSAVVAMDLETGDELWAIEIPYQSGDWITWVGGVMNGKVFASRAGNGASVDDNLYALAAETGQTLWISDDMIDAGSYDGMVFASNGDPVIASFMDIWRISAEDGSTVWHNARLGSVSGSCGGAIYGDSLYVADAAPGGHVLVRYDLATGDRLYESPLMAGFTIQNTPMTGPNGDIYLSRTQNSPGVDYFYAFEDDGEQFKSQWQAPAAWTTTSEFAVGPDGSVYMVRPGPELARLDPISGAVINSVAVTTAGSPRLAIDALGNVFFSNGEFADGRLTVYDMALTELWSTSVTNINIGGPALGQDGAMVVCGVGTDVRVYRSDLPPPTPTPSPSPEPSTSAIPTATPPPPTETPLPPTSAATASPEPTLPPPTDTPTAVPTPPPTAAPSASPAPSLTPAATIPPTQVPSPTALPSPTGTPFPYPLGVRLDLPQPVLPGDTFYVTGYIDNPGPALAAIPVFFILDVFGEYWFWDDWTHYAASAGDIDFAVKDIAIGTEEIAVVPSFAWPDTGGGAVSGLAFWGAMTNPELTGILGAFAHVSWGYGG